MDVVGCDHYLPIERDDHCVRLDLALSSVCHHSFRRVYLRRKEREAAALRLCADLVALLFLDKSRFARRSIQPGRVKQPR
jgi:hypothetical protein